MKQRLFACVLLSGLGGWSAGCGTLADDQLQNHPAGGTPSASGVPTVATITGAPDDYLGLLLLLNHGGVDLQAINVAPGAADPPRAGVAVRRLLRFTENYDVPVGLGRTPPAGKFPAGQFERDTALDRHPVLANIRRGPPGRLTGEQLITATVRDAQAPAALIAMGPLTHLRAAAAAAPDLLGRIRGVYVSGGDLGNFPAVRPPTDEGDNFDVKPLADAAARPLNDLDKPDPKPAARPAARPAAKPVRKPAADPATRSLNDLDALPADDRADKDEGAEPAKPDAKPEGRDEPKPDAEPAAAAEPGRVDPASCNLAADPAAAAAVLDWPVPIYVIPTEVIRTVALDAAFLAELDQTNRSLVGQAASAMLGRYRDAALIGKPASMGNAVAVMAYLRPDLFTWEPRLMTVVDGRLQSRPAGNGDRKVMVAVGCDPIRVRRAAAEILARRAAAGADGLPAPASLR